MCLDPIIRNRDIGKRLVMISPSVGPMEANEFGGSTFAVSNIGAMTAVDSMGLGWVSSSNRGFWMIGTAAYEHHILCGSGNVVVGKQPAGHAVRHAGFS